MLTHKAADNNTGLGEASAEPIALVQNPVPFPVPTADSHIVEHAQLDVNRWRSILSHRVVLEQGMIPANANRGDVLFQLDVSPQALKSQRAKSIICHLGEMFSAWNGTVVFELVMTIPIFVVTKIVLAFVPLPRLPDEFSVEELAGLQNSLVVNPQNQHSAILRCPFIADGNWLSTTRATGSLVARLLENLVFSMDFNGNGIPWTLFVWADPTDFNFRYIIPPSLTVAVDSGVEGQPSMLDNITALVSSTNPGPSYARVGVEAPLVRSLAAATGRQWNSMMLIPRSRVEYLMQKVRGQFTSSGNPTVISDMFDSPVSTLSTYNPLGMTPDARYPYINRPVWVRSFEKDVTNPYPPAGMTDPVLMNVVGTVCKWFYFLVTKEQRMGLDGYEGKLQAYIIVPGYTQHNGATANDTSLPTYTYELTFMWEGRFYDRWQIVENGLVGPYYVGSGLRQGVLMMFKPQSSADQIVSVLRQVDSAPTEVTHLALYTTLETGQAQQLTEWLTTADNSSPPEYCGYHSISFSCNQAQLAYASSRLVEQESGRGIVWRLFKLFNGDETTWWSWLVRGLDVAVDLLIANFLGRDSTQVVDISGSSGFRWEAVGPFKPELVKPTARVRLPPIPQAAPYKTLFDVARSFDETPAYTPVRSVSRVTQSKSPVSRRASRSHQARHPSKKHWFRKDSDLQSGP